MSLPTTARKLTLSALLAAGLLLATGPVQASLDTSPELTGLSHTRCLTERLSEQVPRETKPSRSQVGYESLESRLSRDFELQQQRSRGHAWVDQAPKAWPFPMVFSPGRPVLPGSTW